MDVVKLDLLSGFRIKSKNTQPKNKCTETNSAQLVQVGASPDVHVRCILKEVRPGDAGRTSVTVSEGAPANMTAAPTA